MNTLQITNFNNLIKNNIIKTKNIKYSNQRASPVLSTFTWPTLRDAQVVIVNICT